MSRRELTVFETGEVSEEDKDKIYERIFTHFHSPRVLLSSSASQCENEYSQQKSHFEFPDMKDLTAELKAITGEAKKNSQGAEVQAVIEEESHNEDDTAVKNNGEDAAISVQSHRQQAVIVADNNGEGDVIEVENDDGSAPEDPADVAPLVGSAGGNTLLKKWYFFACQ